MKRLAEACERIAATTKKLEKTAIVADYLKSCAPQEAAASSVFLSGRPFPMWEEATLQVGGSLLWRLVAEISGRPEAEATASYRKLGDLGAVAADILPARDVSELSIVEIENRFRQIAAARGPAAKTALVREFLTQVSPLEAKYIVKIMTGDLRIGLKESLVEEAIAKAYGASLAQVQRANMLLGDIGETTRFAIEGRLDETKMRLFHPMGLMLASPAQNAEEALSYFEQALVEDKYDGIRAQVHVSDSEVRIFSRTRDEITESFPELPDAFSALDDVILDGEIVAWSYLTEDPDGSGRALPFSALQQRLGRKKVTEEMMRRVPVAYLAFDVLYAGGELLIDRPLRERAEILNTLIARTKDSNHKGHKGAQREAQHRLDFGEETRTTAQIIRSAVRQANTPDELDALFE